MIMAGKSEWDERCEQMANEVNAKVAEWEELKETIDDARGDLAEALNEFATHAQALMTCELPETKEEAAPILRRLAQAATVIDLLVESLRLEAEANRPPATFAEAAERWADKLNGPTP